LDNRTSITGDYLSGRLKIETPAKRRKVSKDRQIKVVGAKENNLRDVSVSFPLGVMTAVTGVSGSGKSSLVNDVLYQVLANKLNGAKGVPGRHIRVEGLEQLDKVVHVDQAPIGRTPAPTPPPTPASSITLESFLPTPQSRRCAVTSREGSLSM